MAQFRFFLMLQTCIFGLVLVSHQVEGRCRILPNNTQVCLCHCENNCKNGCQICDMGWSGSRQMFCQKENILFGKPSSQENNYSRLFDSSKAVDGNLATYCKVQEKSERVWWRVDLNTNRIIATISVTMDTVEDAEYSVYVVDESLLTNNYSMCTSSKTSKEEKKKLLMNCSREMIGRAIEIHSPPHVPLKIYEVSSTSCSDGTYGKDCGNLCPIKCHNSCNKTTGECDQCPAGFTGVYCNNICSGGCGSMGCGKMNGLCLNCADGFWGNDCRNRCPTGCSSACQRKTGYCKECSFGNVFNGNTCVQCSAGNFGNSCSSKCNEDCKDGLCIPESGKCTDCLDGKYGEYCHKNCSEKCLNSSCFASTGKCFECADGYEGLQCKQCFRGYFGKGCKNMCNHCKLHQCDHVKGTCSLCEDGTYGPFCNQTCPSACKDKKCLQNGDCIACRGGLYGSQCEYVCPPVWCSNCDKTNGSCLQCQAGRYGSDCLKMCLPGCRDGCSITNGSCEIPLNFNESNSNGRMVNIIILAGTTFLIVFSIFFLAKICRMQKERTGTKRRSHRATVSLREQSSSQKYQNLIEEFPYQNVNVENQAAVDVEQSIENPAGAFNAASDESGARKSVANLSKLYQRIVSFDEVQIRRQRTLSSDSSLSYENVAKNDNSMIVTYSKY